MVPTVEPRPSPERDAPLERRWIPLPGMVRSLVEYRIYFNQAESIARGSRALDAGGGDRRWAIYAGGAAGCVGFTAPRRQHAQELARHAGLASLVVADGLPESEWRARIPRAA